METILSISLGIGLSAACGFRVFVPLLVMSVAALSGHLHLAAGFSWIGSYPALIAFSVATVLEVAGYYIPWVDHLLDVLSSPAAVVAGTVVTASMVTDMSPLMRWTLAAIAGGGAAGLVQGTTVLARSVSTATTGGLGNHLVATLELAGSLVVSIVSVLAPFLAIGLVLIILTALGFRVLARSRPKPVPQV